MTSINVTVHLWEPGEVSVDLDPIYRALDIGHRNRPSVSIFVNGRPVLDALQAALDEIRADMDREAPDANADLVIARNALTKEPVLASLADLADDEPDPTVAT